MTLEPGRSLELVSQDIFLFTLADDFNFWIWISDLKLGISQRVCTATPEGVPNTELSSPQLRYHKLINMGGYIVACMEWKFRAKITRL